MSVDMMSLYLSWTVITKTLDLDEDPLEWWKSRQV